MERYIQLFTFTILGVVAGAILQWEFPNKSPLKRPPYKEKFTPVEIPSPGNIVPSKYTFFLYPDGSVTWVQDN